VENSLAARVRTRWVAPFVLAAAARFMTGCAGAPATYIYHAMNDGCNCEEFTAHDRMNRITYIFRARYRMEEGISTSIVVHILNLSSDTLFLDQGTARISSRNINYQYNNKSVPLPRLIIEPQGSDVVEMTGRDISGDEDWNKIAGEQLTLTLLGLRLGDHFIPQQVVTFIPENPKLQKHQKS
jgi:hypothetical protein